MDLPPFHTPPNCQKSDFKWISIPNYTFFSERAVSNEANSFEDKWIPSKKSIS